MKKLKQTKGITLVALVITIIILLILAGISISALTNQGLFTQAQNAKNLTEEKTAEENAILTNYLEQMNAIIGGQVTESVPDGAIVTPVNDITTWLKTGEISKQYSYTTIEEVIADSTCTESLMNNENAMKYLVRSTEFADSICASETTMTYLGQSAYVDNTVLNSDIWCSSICDSVYMNKVFVDLIPELTSDICEIGTVTKYGYGDESYRIFNSTNENDAVYNNIENVSNSYIQFTFNDTVKLVDIYCSYYTRGTRTKNFDVSVQYMDPNGEWITVESKTLIDSSTRVYYKNVGKGKLKKPIEAKAIRHIQPTLKVENTASWVYGFKAYGRIK